MVRRNQTESSDKDAAPLRADAEISAPMRRFKELAKKLVKVPRHELDLEKQKYEAGKGKSRDHT
jgi:hypothetical protein